MKTETGARTAAKSPSTAIARVLKSFGLKQGHDFRVKGSYRTAGGIRERIGTHVVVLSNRADQLVADHADAIEALAAAEGFAFNVSIHFTAGGRLWTWVANYGQRTRDTAPVTTADKDGAPLDDSSRQRATTLGLKVATTAGTDQATAAADDKPSGYRREALVSTFPKLKLGAPRPAFPLPDADTADQLAQGADAINQAAAAALKVVRLDTDAADRRDAISDRFSFASRADVIAATEATARAWPKGTRVTNGVRTGYTNGLDFGVVTIEGHENYGRAFVGVDWDAVPNDMGSNRRGRPFADTLTILA